MAKSSKTPQQLGKDFEGKIGDELKKLMNIKPCYLHRLYDTTSAGALLPSQPGDFIMLFDGDAWLIEVKSSTKFDSMAGKRETLKLFSGDQVAKMRLWARAGGKTAVIFKSHETGQVELWNGVYIAHCYTTPRLRVDSYHLLQTWYERPNYLRDVALSTMFHEMKKEDYYL